MTTIVREIEFENNSPKVCYSGQLLKGQVNVYFPVNTRVEEIYITFMGDGFCLWQKFGELPITGSKTYLCARVDLLPYDANADRVVPAGHHQYHFEVQLSPTLPTSYEGTFGHIRYNTTLQINRPANKLPPLSETFTVLNALNLNNNPSYREPIKVRKFTKFNSLLLPFCCKTDNLEIVGRLPVRGYCPGQTMNLKLDVLNKSGLGVSYFLVRFVQEVTYIANNGQQKVERIVVSEKKTLGCRADRRLVQSIRVNTLVPSLPRTNFSADVCGCRYMFVIIAHTAMCHHNPTFKVPVVIGTYPISNEQYSSSNDARNVTNPTAALPTTSAFDGDLAQSNITSSDVPPYPDADPPTYEEAIRNIPAKKKGFAPKYPTYRRQTSYASEEA